MKKITNTINKWLIDITFLLTNVLAFAIISGLLFNDSYNIIATLLPESGGYAPLLHGKVVDMLYFPLINSHCPDWMPFWAGEHFIFFRPVFNIADAGIFVGIFMILLFYRKVFN